MRAAGTPAPSFLHSLQHAVSATMIGALGAALLYAFTLPLDAGLLIIVLPVWAGMVALFSFLPILFVGHLLASLRLSAFWFAAAGLALGCAAVFLLRAVGWFPLHDMTGFLAVPTGLIGLVAFWRFDRAAIDG